MLERGAPELQKVELNFELPNILVKYCVYYEETPWPQQFL